MQATDPSSGPSPRLSLVVIAYEMRRELTRTIRSLSPAMQRAIRADEYELIVVDNGSTEPPDHEACDRFGTRIRWLRVDRASPSPAAAINRGIAAATAPLVGVMIDGARIASPGILRHALDAAAIHPRPVIATLGFHLGPDLQFRASAAGYDQRAEDALLDDVKWTEDGYRLFDISVFAVSAAKGWFEPFAESNALFMPAELWAELGGYDEQFRSPGGGLVNVDLFARACALPDIRLIELLGEGTFHQMHGGAATKNPARVRAMFADEYQRLRGRKFRRPKVKPLYLGSPSEHARPSIAASAATAGAALNVNQTLARRYVELLKRGLLNETALEAEAAYLAVRDASEQGETLPDGLANDIRASVPRHLDEVREARIAGRYLRPGEIGFAHTMAGRARLDNLDHCVSTALLEHVGGDLVECGVWRGGGAILMRGILAAWGVNSRTVWLADSFKGLPAPDHPKDPVDLGPEQRPELAVSQEQVAANFELFGLLDERVRFLPGFFNQTLPGAPIEKIAVLRLDGALYQSTMAPLTALYDRVSPGGFVIVDGYGALAGCRQAVEEFRAEQEIDDRLIEIDRTGVYWRKTSSSRRRDPPSG